MILWVIVVAALLGRGIYEAINQRGESGGISALTGDARG